ncbi:MAG: hypothetical protein M0R51_05990 [Clostridia bacterium]|jgi:hypothetical protein|nr:hypothetical protein [Clostridia bacterium]
MIELKIDNELRDLIPPLTEEEYKGLEDNLLSEGYDETLPIIVWKGHETIVDGHNRYSICQKHNIPFVTVEREFNTKEDVKRWMCDIQLSRRSPNKKKRTYIIGRRYLIEKLERGVNRYTNKTHQNDESKDTRFKLAEQLSIGAATVERAANFTTAVDRIVIVTGCKVNDLLDDYIKGTMEEINKLAELDEETQKRIIAYAITGKENIELAATRVSRENRDILLKEAEEKRHAMEAQLKKEREEKEEYERKKLEIEREERLKLEKERIAKEKEDRENERLAEIVEQVLSAEKEDEEEEEILEDGEAIAKEKEAIEKAKLEAEIKHMQEVQRKKLENIMLEQKRVDEEILRKATLERERHDRERVEKAVKAAKAAIPVTPYDPYIKCAKVIMGEITLTACKSKNSLYIIDSHNEYEDPQTLNKNWSGKVWLDLLSPEGEPKKYIEKLVSRYLDGGVVEAIAIVRNDTSAEWFKLCAQNANAVVFPLKGELKNHALIYFGKNTETFMSECLKFGWGITLKN